MKKKNAGQKDWREKAINKICLVGRLTADPEIIYSPEGKARCRFSLAVERRYRRGATDFFDCVAWSGNAETAANYLKKGYQVGISGSMESNDYEDRNGVKKRSWAVNVSEITLLYNRRDSGSIEKDQWSDIGSEIKPGMPVQQNYNDEVPF